MKKIILFFLISVNLSAFAENQQPSCLPTGSKGAYACAAQSKRKNCLIMKGAGYSCEWGIQEFSCIALPGGNGAACAYQKDQKNCNTVSTAFKCAWVAEVIPQ